VPEWAKQPTKPTYTADEVGAVNKTGDTMTGTLHVNNGGNSVFIKPTSESSS